MRWALRPPSLISNLILVVLAALVLQFAGNTLLYEHAEIDRASRVKKDHLAEKLAVAARALTVTDNEERPLLAEALSTNGVSLTWRQRSMIESGIEERPEVRDVREHLLRHQPELGNRALRLDSNTTGPRQASSQTSGELRLPDGSFLGFTALNLGHELPEFLGILLSTALLAAGLLIITIMLTRSLGSPLRLLAKAADDFGHGTPVPVPVPVQGPREVHQLARALNSMQDRISQLVLDRTQALAAVSHDLRTPIARLRLRTDVIADHALQSAIETDLDEMESMVGSILAYLKGDTNPETPRPVDMVALLTTLIDAAVDAGRDVTYQGPSRAVLVARPLAMKRALSNLIENAVKYGGCARVCVQCSEAKISILVDDDGPGIPEEELKRVLEPFYRLEDSRNRDTGGVGLGLAIARQAIEANGGQIVLLNRLEGGLRAEITLPRR
jgi:signal transduction histidine kinase